MATADAATALLNSTLNNYRGKLVDNVFKKRVLSWILMEKNRTRMEAGGNNITEHVLLEEGQAQEYAEWEAVSIVPQGGIYTADFPWKSIVSTIAISGMERFKNSGDARLVNLLKSRVMQSEKTLQKLANDSLWGVSAGGQGWDSILDLIDDTAVVGGIDPAVQTLWASPVTDLFDDAAPNAGTSARLLEVVTNLFNTASDGADEPTALVGDQASHEIYELGLNPQLRYTNTKSADAGFKNVAIKDVPFYFDKAAPVGTIIGINPEYLTLVGGKGRWFKQTPFSDDPIDAAATAGNATWVDAQYSVISAFGNVTTNDRSKHFKITNFNQVT